MVGAIYDLLTLPGQVREANMRNSLYGREYTYQRPAGEQENWRYADDANYRVVNDNGNEKETP